MNHFLIKYFVEKSRGLEGQRISSILFPSEQEFVLGFGEQRIYINLSTQNPSLITTSLCFDPIKTSNSFFSMMRSKLHHLILDEIFHRGLERVVTFRFVDARGGIVRKFNLVVELLDRATNAVLVGEDGYVIHAYKVKRLRGMKKYFPVVSGMPDMMLEDEEYLRDAYIRGENILGMGGFLRRVVDTPEKFTSVLRAAREAFSAHRFSLNIYGGREVYPFSVDVGIEHSPIGEREVEEMVVLRPRELAFKQRKDHIISAIKKRLSSLKVRLKKIEEDLRNTGECEHLRVYAENLMAHPDAVPSRDGYVRCIDVYTNAPIEIPIDRTKSVFENADAYFKRYRKLKRSVSFIKRRKSETIREREYVSQLLFDVERSDTLADLVSIEDLLMEEGFIQRPFKVKAVKTPPYERLEISGFDVYVGKNARGNDYVLKLARGGDLWFHPHGRPGPHLILKNPNRLKSIDEGVILRCAIEVAKRTKVRDKVDIDFTFARYVKKPRGLKPGMVIYSNFKTIRVDLCT